MGTDIHAIVRVTKKGKEVRRVEVPDMFLDRDYDFFTVLANVRNGTGFAMSERYTRKANYYTDERGFPKGFKPLGEAGSIYFEEGHWAGYHDFGYVTSSELIAQYDVATQVVEKVGLFSLDDYKKKLSGDTDFGWCGDVRGKKVVKIEGQDIDINFILELEKIEKKTDKSIFIKHKWETQPFKDKIDELIKFLEVCKRGPDEETQFIFGFDS